MGIRELVGVGFTQRYRGKRTKGKAAKKTDAIGGQHIGRQRKPLAKPCKQAIFGGNKKGEEQKAREDGKRKERGDKHLGRKEKCFFGTLLQRFCLPKKQNESYAEKA